MALQLNDWVWLRLSNRYGVTSAEAQLGDVFKRWLDERGGTWGYSLVDFYASKNVAGTTFTDGAYNYWSGGALQDATFWIDAFSGAGTSVANLGSGGSALNARYGSTSGVDISDPVLLTHTGTNYLYTTGVVGNDATTPSATPLNINGNIECVIRVALDDWTPTAAATLVSKYNGTASTGGYEFQINPTGEMRSVWDNGVAVVGVQSNAIPSFMDGTAYWLKYTIQPNNGAGGANCDFYWAADQSVEPSTWTRLGTQVVTTTTVNSIATSTAGLRVGSRNGTSNQSQGKFYRVIVRDGIGGTTVFDANFTTGITSGAQVTFTESSVNAATVTINRAVSGRKSVAVVRPVWLFGTDDYMEVAADPYGAGVTTNGTAGSYIGQTWVTSVTSTATAGAATTLTDSVQTWTVDAYANLTVRITGGTGAGQIRRIASNTATVLTVTTAWTTIPDATSTYVIESNGNIEGDIEIVVRCSLANWSSTAQLVAKPNVNTAAYRFYKEVGSIRFAFATAAAPATPTVAIVTWNPTFAANTVVWLRVTRVASTGVITFQWAADQATEPTVWTAIGSATLATGAPVSNTSPVRIGEGTSGVFYSAVVRSGIAGLSAADWAAFGHPASGGSYRGVMGNVWSLTNATVSNANPLNFGSTDSFTLVAILRQWGNPASFARIILKTGYTVAVPSYALLNYNANGKVYFTISDSLGLGTNTAATATTFNMGDLTVVTAVRNTVADQVSHYYNNTLASGPFTDPTTNPLASANPLLIGGSAGAYNDFELFAIAIIPKALTAAEIARIVAAYQ